MGVIFDTSLLIEAERRESEISRFAESREEEVFGISVITVTELLHGVPRADIQQKKRWGERETGEEETWEK